jgi:hypothetical protein
MSVFWTCQFQFCPAGGCGMAVETGKELVETPAAVGSTAPKSAHAVMAGLFFKLRTKNG